MGKPKRDVLIGFLGWFLINALIWLVLDIIIYYFGIIGFTCLVLPANMAVFIGLALTRRSLAAGAITAYVANFLVTLFLHCSFWGILAIPFTSLIYYD